MIRQTQQLYAAVLGGNLETISEMAALLEAVAEGRSAVITFHQWGSQGAHQLVVDSLDESGRIHFFNPSADSSQVAGANLGGADGTPPRRVEANGLQSLDSSTLGRLFKAGSITVQVSGD